MNNLLSYCALIDAKIRASDKDLPVQKTDASAGHSEQQIASNQQDQKVEELSVVKQQKTVSLR